MWAWIFLQRQCQNWQERKWQRYDDTTPYWIGHKKRQRALDCVGEYHFKVYCRAGARLRKFYWNIHPNERLTWQK